MVNENGFLVHKVQYAANGVVLLVHLAAWVIPGIAVTWHRIVPFGVKKSFVAFMRYVAAHDKVRHVRPTIKSRSSNISFREGQRRLR